MPWIVHKGWKLCQNLKIVRIRSIERTTCIPGYSAHLKGACPHAVPANCSLVWVVQVLAAARTVTFTVLTSAVV